MLGQRKVIFVNRFFYPDESATSQILTDLAVRLAARGVRAVVVSSRLIHAGNRRVLPPQGSVQGVDVVRIWTTSFGRSGPGRVLDYLSFYLMAVVAVFRLATRGDVVVAKTDPPMLSIALLLPATLRGALLINWLQDLFPEVLQELARRKVPRFLYEVLKGLRDASLRRAAANVAIGTQMKALLERQRVPLETIRVIPNWADARAILPVPPSDNVLRREWGLGDAVIIGYSGNLGRVHELEIILKAAQRTLHDNRLMFVFIGSGYQRPRLEALKAEWSLTNVIFKDPVPRRHLGSSLTLPDVHLVSLKPALEGLVVPSKIYGVMAAGLPCIFIGSPEGEVGRLLSMAPAAGLSIAPGNDEHLASALLELAANQSLRRAMGAAARQRFLANFDVEIAVDSWYELIRDTVKRH